MARDTPPSRDTRTTERTRPQAAPSSSSNATGGPARSGASRPTGEWLLLGVATLIWLAVVLIPIAYIIIQTLKTQEEALASEPWSLSNPTLDNYRTVLG